MKRLSYRTTTTNTSLPLQKDKGGKEGGEEGGGRGVGQTEMGTKTETNETIKKMMRRRCEKIGKVLSSQ
jgi:hypothetical protein